MTENLFSAEELEVLADVVREYLKDLHSEILETDSYEYRQDLRLNEQRVKDLLRKIEQVLLMPTE